VLGSRDANASLGSGLLAAMPPKTHTIYL
jgi:hypothetical protein